MTCKNCDYSLKGQFCSQCGQNSRVDKINLPNFLSEFSDSVFQINRGLLFTLKELSIRPGHSIREFLNGKRKNHFKPIAFVLALSTIYYLVSQISDSQTIIDYFFSGFNYAGKDNNAIKHSSGIINWLSNNYAYATLLLLPFFSLATYIAFIGVGRNYLEHIVINSYVTGQQALLYSCFIVIGILVNNDDMTVSLAVLISMIFNFWTFKQLFQNKKVITVILRLILAYFIYYIIISLLLSILVFETLMKQ